MARKLDPRRTSDLLKVTKLVCYRADTRSQVSTCIVLLPVRLSLCLVNLPFNAQWRALKLIGHGLQIQDQRAGKGHVPHWPTKRLYVTFQLPNLLLGSLTPASLWLAFTCSSTSVLSFGDWHHWPAAQATPHSPYVQSITKTFKFHLFNISWIPPLLSIPPLPYQPTN